MSVGYTDPFHSSTGLNFLVTVLSTFADGHEESMLSQAVTDTFQQFQRSVPFVAISTVEMQDSVLKGGSLDAFVIDSQSFETTEELQSDYQFIPYGIKNDYPLYGIGELSKAKLEVLEMFAQVAERPNFQRKSNEYGWNEKSATDYQPEVALPTGDFLLKAQKLWKQKKDAGHPISAVFVADVSGSMSGSRLLGLRQALIQGSEYIGAENSIGLVVFSSDVKIVQPIHKFDLLHRSRFTASAIDMTISGGNTAMYNGIVVALSMLVDEKKRSPDTRPMLFVLTDGETNDGLSYDDVAEVVSALKIPIHTIGYEADLAELERVSRLVEATTISAKVGDVVYNIASLLNAKM
jgi:Ca-activated chloride channel family protein